MEKEKSELMPNLNSQASLDQLDSTKQKSGLWWLWVSVIVFVLDQWTKIMATKSLELYQAVVVNDYLNWTLMHNEGMAFSFLADASLYCALGIF